jgi:hypothetical protein
MSVDLKVVLTCGAVVILCFAPGIATAVWFIATH